MFKYVLASTSMTELSSYFKLVFNRSNLQKQRYNSDQCEEAEPRRIIRISSDPVWKRDISDELLSFSDIQLRPQLI
jgi:hypothetical protein